MLASLPALAVTLDDLSRQLRAHPLVHGSFLQEKHLRALEQPLTSRGTFVLAQELGLLWRMEQPITQHYRIDAEGVARWRNDAWQPDENGGAAQQRLFLAALSGDVAALQRDFEIALQESGDGWQALLTPRGAILKQIFDRIELSGDRVVKRIELLERNGDRTVIQLQAEPADALSAQERADFGR